MSDEEDEIHSIPWASVAAVLWSEEEFDGIRFDEDKDGVTVVYSYGGMWALNLFLLALAKAVAPTIEPDFEGFKQIYHSLAELTMSMSLPVPAPKYGDDYVMCRLPNIRITGIPSDN